MTFLEGDFMKNNKIYSFEYNEMGFKRQYENSQWTVAIKNYDSNNDIETIESMDKHLMTDEIFVLIEGETTLVCGEYKADEWSFDFIPMKKGVVYVVPKNCWHNTITYPGCKLIVVENSDTTWDNSEKISLNKKLKAYME